MATITQGGITYTIPDSVTDIQSVIDRIKRAKAGEIIPGVTVASLPDHTEPATVAAGSSLITFGLLGALGYFFLKR